MSVAAGIAQKYACSIEMHAQAQTSLAAGVSSNVRLTSDPVPLYFARGEGPCLFDVDGNRTIDYVLGNGPALLGHAPPAVIAAVRDSLADGQVFGGQNLREVALGAALCRVLPNAELIRFATSGTEAVQMALRLARAFTGRDRIVKFEGHYHGWVDSVSFSVRAAENAAGPADQPVAVPESPGIALGADDGLIVLGWNDLAAVEALLAARGDEIAAVLMEPVMVNGGLVFPVEGYLAGVQAACRAHGVLFICDEVITGFRLGLHGGQGLAGVQPDLSVYAKAISGGFPLSAVAGRRDVMQLLGRGVNHGGTYNAHVQSMAAALAVLDELTRDDGEAYKTLDRCGRRLMTGLADLAARHGLPLQVHGAPAVFQTAFATGPMPRNFREAARHDQLAARAFVSCLHEEGVRVAFRCVWFMSTTHDEVTVDDTLARVDRAMARFKAAEGAIAA